MTCYIAIIRKDKDSEYGVSFPDFPGCISAGSTLDEARTLGQEALEAYTDFLREEGHELPDPTSLESAIKSTYRDGIFATMVMTLEPEKAKLERVNISIPSRELARIDRYAASHGLTRSAFLIQAARSMIQRGA